MSFLELFESYQWSAVCESFHRKTQRDVENALVRTGERTLDDFCALLSPAALPYLEEMAKRSQAITQRRFGKTLQLYAPLYLSNECQNICTYCGFSFQTPFLG
ncbi:MAG: hypothetical protein KDD60_02770 [Bdellovibrionales bacterium]|nr:hypothetical protein [Bdellovibrionales bacterium]